jgi:hypothetical protein
MKLPWNACSTLNLITYLFVPSGVHASPTSNPTMIESYTLDLSSVPSLAIVVNTKVLSALTYPRGVSIYQEMWSLMRVFSLLLSFILMHELT